MHERPWSPARASTVELPQRVEDQSTQSGGYWIVTVFDNDHNTVEQVIFILVLATGCTEAEAEIETWEIHNLGKSVVHHGQQAECERVADIIRTIGIRVEVTEED